MNYSCVWVPGTLDRVKVSVESLQAEWSLGEVFRLLGTRAVHDLYLRGRASGERNEPLAWPLGLARPRMG